MDRAQPVRRLGERVEQKVVVHAGKRIDRVEAMGEQRGDGRLRGGHAGHARPCRREACSTAVDAIPSRASPWARSSIPGFGDRRGRNCTISAAAEKDGTRGARRAVRPGKMIAQRWLLNISSTRRTPAARVRKRGKGVLSAAGFSKKQAPAEGIFALG